MLKIDCATKDIKILGIELSRLCNFDCTMCNQIHLSQKSELKEKIWRQTLKPLYRNILALSIMGGEITFSKNCRNFVSFIVTDHPHIKISTSTNGALFDNSWQEIFLKKGNDVNFSINASNREAYKKINKADFFSQVAFNLGSLIEKRNNAKSPLRISASFVILNENFLDIDDFIELCLAKKVDAIYFKCDSYAILPKKNQERIIKLNQTFQKYSLLLDKNIIVGLREFSKIWSKGPKGVNGYKYSPSNSFCREPWQSLYINTLGDVSFCCHAKKIGNIYRESLNYIWCGKKARVFREAVKNNDYKYCSRSCQQYKIPDNTKTMPAWKKNFEMLGNYLPKAPIPTLEAALRYAGRKLGSLK